LFVPAFGNSRFLVGLHKPKPIMGSQTVILIDDDGPEDQDMLSRPFNSAVNWHVATYRTKQAKDFRTLMSNEILSGHSIEAFMKLPVMQRLATYREKLEAPGMIEMCDPSTISTDLATHCIASIPNQHARSFLAASALNLLPPKAQEVWREAQRHFWRNNVFVVNASHLKAVLNDLNARIKSYVGMIHVDLEALDDMDGLACYNPSHLDGKTSQTLEGIRQQNQDLRRLIQECYNLAWARIHVHKISTDVVDTFSNTTSSA
ncbi:hypothetical protein KCU83_g633, partial [Aureobasidium melanogenum]